MSGLTYTREQNVAALDTTTGEIEELRLRHDGDAVERFYGALPPPVTVAIAAHTEVFGANRRNHNSRQESSKKLLAARLALP